MTRLGEAAPVAAHEIEALDLFGQHEVAIRAGCAIACHHKRRVLLLFEQQNGLEDAVQFQFEAAVQLVDLPLDEDTLCIASSAHGQAEGHVGEAMEGSYTSGLDFYVHEHCAR